MQKQNFIPYIISAAIFIALEIAALSMLRNSGELQDIWISRIGHGVMKGLWGSSQKITNYFSLAETNDALAEENHELLLRIHQLEDALKENGIHSGPAPRNTRRFRFTNASIIKISTNSQHNYFIIDKGKKDGIVNGSGVITPNGAVGIIDAVSDNYSYVISFQNHNMNITARIGRDGRHGPMSWDGIKSNGAILREIPHHLEIVPGDTIYTSGFSSIFPSDIPLGTIRKASIVNGATYDIKVTLFEDFGALRYVTVVENIGDKELRQLEDR